MTSRLKVIIVDDEAIVCERLKSALEKAGFYVETFTDSQLAIDRLSTEKFNVLVTDLKMPKIGGVEVMNFAKQQSPWIKVIIITGFATVDGAIDALKRGASDFIAKPFKISQLRDLIVKIAEIAPD